MDATKKWFDNFLQVRNLEKPLGQMLFRYRTSKSEYLDLKQVLAARFTALSGVPWRFNSRAECALFVLYASEWWKHEYAGGVWRWHDIFQSLTTEPYKVEIPDRSIAVVRGLYAWGLRPSEDGHKYLGAIVANGGLPLQMLARGDGVFSRLLLSATGKAQRWGWETPQLIGYFESHADDMVKHLREPEIYHLLAEMVMSVLMLRREYRLAGLSNPVEVLEQRAPQWRERFPVLAKDAQVESLLIGLVREASYQVEIPVTYPVVITHTLVAISGITDSYTLSMEVQMPAAISVEAFAFTLGISPSDVPSSFILEMAGEPSLPLGQCRQSFSQQGTILLPNKARRFMGKEAYREMLLSLHSEGGIKAYASVPGGDALDETQPWCFTLQNDVLTLAGIGSCKIALDCAYVLVPDEFTCSVRTESRLELVGLVEDLPQPRWLYQLTGIVDIQADGQPYCIRTHSVHQSNDVFVWKGSRFAGHPVSLPVFKGVPRLYRRDSEGLIQPVSETNIVWTQPMRQGAVVPYIQQHRGPVDAWLLAEGQRQRRFRMVVIAPTAEISYQSGINENEAAIEFQNWGVTALHTAAALSPQSSVTKASVKLSMLAQQQPPASISVTAQWSFGWPQLQLQLPFPARSGRFARSDGSVFPHSASISLQRIHDVRVQVFDQNPNAPKRYKLQIQLLSNSQDGHLGADNPVVEVKIPILEKQHIGELRFFEIASTLNALFTQNSNLDACLCITLFAGSIAVRSLNLTRYDLELEREQQWIIVPRTQLIDMTSEQLEALELCAVPLLEIGTAALSIESLRSDGALVGRWDMAQLPVGHSPWLIYPAQNVNLQVRSMHWHTTPFDTLGTFQALGDALCPLGKAMSSPLEDSRDKALSKVVLTMSEDFYHPSWKLLAQQYEQFKHLPLNTLDYWRVISSNPIACLAAVLILSGEIQELMIRMRDDLGVMWELTSESCLRNGLKKFWSLLQNQLGTLAQNDLLTDLVKNTFTKIGQVSESLALQVDRLLYQELGIRSDNFERMVADYGKTPQALLQMLWHSEDSFLQCILLRHHAHQDVWPNFKIVEKMLKQITLHSGSSVIDFFLSLGKKLVWSPTAPSGTAVISPKQDVANAPLLLGILIQITDAMPWLQSNGHMVALRQIKAFDPIWFEVGLQMGALLALKAREHTTATCRT